MRGEQGMDMVHATGVRTCHINGHRDVTRRIDDDAQSL
jgi:hypothetical protein